MAALEANKQVSASYDPCDDSCEDQWAGSSTSLPPGDFPPGARRPDDPRRSAAPYRAPEAPQPTLAERLERIETDIQHLARSAERGLAGAQRMQHDISWLTEHWHQAVDRASELLGGSAHSVPRAWWWACGFFAGAGLGIVARGLF